MDNNPRKKRIKSRYRFPALTIKVFHTINPENGNDLFIVRGKNETTGTVFDRVAERKRKPDFN